MNKIIPAFITAAVMNISGCSTIVNGTEEQQLSITSNVEAQIYYDGETRCTTPCTITLQPNTPAIAVIAEGYENRLILLKPEHNLATDGNLLLAPLGAAGVGRVVDTVTGTTHQYNNSDLHVVLKKEKA